MSNQIVCRETEERQVSLLWHDGHRWYSSGPMGKEWAMRARALLLPYYPRLLLADLQEYFPQVGMEDLGFVSYAEKPVSLEQRCRRRARFMTARWLLYYRKISAHAQQRDAIFLTADGIDNWLAKKENP